MKKLLLILGFCVVSGLQSKEIAMKKVVLVISGTGFQQREYGNTKKELEAAGIKVVTTSDDPKEAIGSRRARQKIDIKLDQINPAEFAGIFVIGGPGALDHLDIPEVYKVLRKFFALNKPYGAICISPRILANAGVLENRNVTGWNGDNKLDNILGSVSAKYIKEDVVVDGKLITAFGPEAAKSFGNKILEVV